MNLLTAPLRRLYKWPASLFWCSAICFSGSQHHNRPPFMVHRVRVITLWLVCRWHCTNHSVYSIHLNIYCNMILLSICHILAHPVTSRLQPCLHAESINRGLPLLLQCGSSSGSTAVTRWPTWSPASDSQRWVSEALWYFAVVFGLSVRLGDTIWHNSNHPQTLLLW